MPKQNNKFNIAIIIFLIILVISIIIINVNNSKKDNYNGMTDEEIAAAVNEKIDKIEVNSLASLGEKERMEKYVANFTSAVENKAYEEAYDMLYEEFKKSYFPTYEKFEEYAKNKFPETIALEHTNFERIGDTYVLWVNVLDILKGKDSAVEMNFIVREYDLNDYVLSFSVI